MPNARATANFNGTRDIPPMVADGRQMAGGCDAT